jgi:hypothetical protein
MNRAILACVVFTAAATLGAQEQQQAGGYSGVSHPPADDIVTSQDAPAAAPKPHPGQLAQPAQTASAAAPAPQERVVGEGVVGNDDGIVPVAPAPQPRLNQRPTNYDPDGDIVHPDPLGPGQIEIGTMIRVRLLDSISTAYTVNGDPFRSSVATDVLQNGQVLIPAGAEIDGHVVNIATGTVGGHGSMNLRPETVILPDGSRFRLYARLSATPGSRTVVGREGTVEAGSRAKRNTIEYAGAAGTGVIAGAALGGPVGALAGGLVGAGLVTIHLLVSHPQATLESGTPVVFTLSERLTLTPVARAGN